MYHINAVDCVTQWEVVATVLTLAREHMLPVLRAMLEQFPFRILGFHSDACPGQARRAVPCFLYGISEPFLNLHRPCLFGTEVPDPRKPGRTRRVHRHEDVMTPLEKLLTLPEAASFLREDITLDALKQPAHSMTDIGATRDVLRAG